MKFYLLQIPMAKKKKKRKEKEDLLNLNIYLYIELRGSNTRKVGRFTFG